MPQQERASFYLQAALLYIRKHSIQLSSSLGCLLNTKREEYGRRKRTVELSTSPASCEETKTAASDRILKKTLRTMMVFIFTQVFGLNQNVFPLDTNSQRRPSQLFFGGSHLVSVSLGCVIIILLKPCGSQLLRSSGSNCQFLKKCFLQTV